MGVPVLNMLGELNRGFMFTLIMYSNEKDESAYNHTLHSVLVVARDIKSLAETLNVKDLPEDCEELGALMRGLEDITNLTVEDVKKKASDINPTSAEKCIEDVRRKLSFLNDKFNYYEE